uniref:fructose-bisphosphatase n=1 Tax=Lotharella oceanica TaxID=641309 RepID=A0A7S2U572_9EUKA|mmetsp:Transcript_8416/g.16510  ORF Transcript_8416/g.16510 Transcript_8416/m.16510 type:complete len:347 (+) Transcript_8416:71-1111(+)
MTDAKKLMTLTHYLKHYETSHSKEVMADIVNIMSAIQVGAKMISKTVNRAGLGGSFGGSLGGGMVRKLDVLANETMIDAMADCHQVYVMASEESRDPIILRDDPGGYEVVFDPLDGSQNIDCNMSLGTIFGIYEKTTSTGGMTSEKNVLKKGTKLVASGIVHYGAATMLVMTAGGAVHGFILDQDIGEFLLARKRISIPRRAPIYSTNESASDEWDPIMKQFMQSAKKSSKSRKAMKSRYVGTMVADVHRSLLYGGLYLYPSSKSAPLGKVRLLYECNPIAFLIEKAGGKAFSLDPKTGKPVRVLEIQPTKLHQRIPFFCGSYDDIAELEQMYAKASEPKKLPSKL